ncbi:MAG: hypothetical protein K9K81_07085 [Desulfobacteraceae bacterium]|nr:hypothetical protein [Desulfobacteraceae bacterium]
MISKYISRKANQWQNLRNRRRVLIIEDFRVRSQHFQSYHQGQCLVDFVGNFENMDAHWQILSEKTGLEKPPGSYRHTGAETG